MKPINLKEYIEDPSLKVVTREGKPVRIICTNKQSKFPVVALIMDNGVEDTFNFTEDGLVLAGDITNFGDITKYDLFFIPEKKEGWICLYDASVYNEEMPFPGTLIYKTKEEALKTKHYSGYIGIAHVEWEK